MKWYRSKNIDVVERELQPFIQIDFLLKRNSAPHTGMLLKQNRSHTRMLQPGEGWTMPCILLQYILQNLPELKPTHTSLPTPTTYSICTSPTCAHSYLPLPLLLLPTYTAYTCTYRQWLGYLLLGRRRLAGSKLRQALYGGSPTVAQCLPLQTCKLPKTARTAQNCAKAWSVCKPAKEQQRRLLVHNLPYARAFCPYKATSTQPPPLTSYSPVTPPYSSHPSLHTSRESLSCSRSIESQPCGKYSIEGRIESLYAAICLISPCMGSLVRPDVHTRYTKGVSG